VSAVTSHISLMPKLESFGFILVADAIG